MRIQLEEHLRTRLPSHITYTYRDDGKTVCMTLEPQYAGLGDRPQNMQTDGAAFEAWALFLHVYSDCEVVLGVAPHPDADRIGKDANGHYNRFLYRVYKFSAQFSEWFSCESELETRVKRFAAYLISNSFTNNVPSKEASHNDKPEIRAERALAEEKEGVLIDIAAKAGLVISPGQIYRQLPVGLFEGAATEENCVFTGRKSAVDLWTAADDKIAIFELKVDNPMAGIITETMFYANYMYDLFVAANSSMIPNPKVTRYRGYERLISQTYSGVLAYFLAEYGGLHPKITDKVIAEMNRNAVGITYGSLSYDRNEVLA